MKRTMLAALCIFSIAGCDDSKKTNSPATSATAPAAPAKDRDNSAVNVRDRDESAKTPFDQKENKADISVTADIRKRVVASDMSTDAKNVKIITQDGHVTLRGPVKSAAEKAQIRKIAVEIAGEGKVDDQLEVANQR